MPARAETARTQSERPARAPPDTLTSPTEVPMTRHSLLAAGLLLLAPAFAAAGPLEIAWAVRAGGPTADKARGIAADAAGNVYLTGEFGETADFGEFTLTSRGGLDFFLAKYDATGKCLWVRQGGGAKTDRGYAVAVDA